MDDRESSTDVDDPFLEASDEFPFFDCIEATTSGSISDPESIKSKSSMPEISESSPEISSSEGLRRRKPLVNESAEEIFSSDSKISKANPSVSFNDIVINTGSTSATSTSTDRKYGFHRKSIEDERRKEILESFLERLSSGNSENPVKEEAKSNSTVTYAEDGKIDHSATVDPQPGVELMENRSRKEKLESVKTLLSSASADNQLKEEDKENSTVTSAEDAKADQSATVVSQPGVVNDESSSSNMLLFFAGLLVKAIGFQMNLLVSFITFPIWLMYYWTLFISNPCRAVRKIRRSLKQKLLRIRNTIYESLTPVWLKEEKSVSMLVLRLGLGFLWSVYVCVILVSLLVFAFLISHFLMNFFVYEPVQMKETLNFDYTENSPVAFVPIMSCSGVENGEKGEIVKLDQNRIIPRDHKLMVTVSLTLPESVYNRNLGNFQVDLLSVNGTILQSLRRPCILNFKSEPIRIMLTLLRIAPLITGYALESQTLTIPFDGLTEKDIPTSCLKVTVEQRAEFRPTSGIPEIYAASLALESKLPLLKRIIWNWKTTIYIWFSMTVFVMELLMVLLCCKPIIMPQTRLRGGSSNSNASQDSGRIRR